MSQEEPEKIKARGGFEINPEERRQFRNDRSIEVAENMARVENRFKGFTDSFAELRATIEAESETMDKGELAAMQDFIESEIRKAQLLANSLRRNAEARAMTDQIKSQMS
jgi:hypothetical protein